MLRGVPWINPTQNKDFLWRDSDTQGAQKTKCTERSRKWTATYRFFFIHFCTFFSYGCNKVKYNYKDQKTQKRSSQKHNKGQTPFRFRSKPINKSSWITHLTKKSTTSSYLYGQEVLGGNGLFLGRNGRHGSRDSWASDGAAPQRTNGFVEI